MEEEQKKSSKPVIVIIIIVVVLLLALVCCTVGILAGMFAPAYLKYQEKARTTGDLSRIQAVFTYAEVIASDPMYGVTETYFVVEVDQNGAITVTDGAGNEINHIEMELYQLVGSRGVELHSKQYTSTSSYCSFTYHDDPVAGGYWTSQTY